MVECTRLFAFRLFTIPRSPRLVLIATCISFALAIEAVHLARHAALFLPMPVFGDADYFFAMGRAWLNHLAFYRDLFETKPPGVFLLAAVSLRVAGSSALYGWIQLMLLACLGPVAAFSTYKALDESSVTIRWIGTALSLLLGLMIAVQAYGRSWGNEPEGFALLFAVVPALLLTLPCTRRQGVVLDILGGVSLALAAMLKEPFAASAVLAMLVFCFSGVDAIRVVRVVVIAGVGCWLVLGLSHAISGYITIYLPEIFGGRSIANVAYNDYAMQRQLVISAPLWARSLNAYRLLSNLAIRWPGIGLEGLAFACLSLWAPLRMNARRLPSILASGTVVAAGLFSGHNAFVLQQIISGLDSVGKVVPWSDAIIVRLTVSSTVGPVALVLGLVAMPRRWGVPWRVVALSGVAVVAVMLCAALVSYGGDQPRYFILGYAPLLALVLWCLRTGVRQRAYWVVVLIGVLLTLNALMPGRFDYAGTSAAVEYETKKAEGLQAAALALDQLLTDCKQDRYMLGDNQLDGLPPTRFIRHISYRLA